MTDPTEEIRIRLQGEINQGDYPIEGETFTTEQLREQFEVLGFQAPFVVVKRKADGVRGTLMFRHHPRIYFGFEPVEGGET